MTRLMVRWCALAVMVLLVGLENRAEAAKTARTNRGVKEGKPVEAEVVDFFTAAKEGEIEVRVIAKDSTTGNVLIKNKSKKPLSIKLPEAVVGVPAQAQFGGGFGGMGGMGGGMGGMGGMGGGMGGMGMGGMQGFGGGMMGGMGGGMGGMGMGGGMGGMGMGGGFFKVEPEKVGKLKLNIMCLEHGKKDPSPHVKYELKPAEEFTNDPKVIELVKMLARNEIDQRSAQAAAWHLANGLSWRELTTKIGVKHLNGSTEPYFTADQIKRGMLATMEAERRAKENAKDAPSKESSLSTASNQ